MTAPVRWAYEPGDWMPVLHLPDGVELARGGFEIQANERSLVKGITAIAEGDTPDPYPFHRVRRPRRHATRHTHTTNRSTR